MLIPNVGPAIRKDAAGYLFMVTLILMLILYLFLPRAALSAPAKLSDEAETCLTCHASPGTKTFSDKTTVSVQVDGKGFASSVHGPLGCTSCHTDVKLDNHPSAT